MSVASQKHKVYVNSIDGFRAVCCLGVLFYHMNYPFAQGGLMGVTSFFIISGYLITSGLLKELSRARTIDIAGFYVRRVRRLMPAVVAMILGTAALCILFDHVLFTKMRDDILPSLFMYINWSKIFANESYFASAGQPSPLTCYWSLAIEWQFYLVWPPVLLLLTRLRGGRRTIPRILLVLTALSAILMAVLYVPGEDPTRVYYGTDTRLMSILLGCWLAFVWPFKRRGSTPIDKVPGGRLLWEAVGFGSIAGLVLLMVFVDGFSPFSYYGGILLVSILSTAAVAAITPQGSLISRIMGARPLVWLGQRSYSLYLWHYPIIELLTNPNSTTGSPWYLQVLMIALSFLAADLSFRFVEEPIRHGGWFGRLASTLSETFGGRRAGWSSTSAGTPKPKRDLLPLPERIMATVMAACLVVTCVGLAFVPRVDAMGGVGDESRTTAAALKQPLASGVHDVVFIGDSVMLDVEAQMSEAFPYAAIDCKIGRQAQEGIEIYEDYDRQGVVGDTVVFSLGSNGELTAEILEDLVAAVGDGKQVWFINNRMIEDFRDANNELIAQCVSAHDNVGLIDWFGLSAAQDGWFWNDGEHIRQGSDGEWAFVNLIRDTIGYELPATAQQTYSVLFLGDGVPLDASDELAAAFPEGCIDCAAGRMPDKIAETYGDYPQKNVVGDKVVVAVGTEDRFKQGELDQIYDAVGDSKTIYVVNVRMPGRFCDQNNDDIAALAAEHDNCRIVDWHAASEGHDEYFIGDGEHLSDEGREAYAKVVSSAVS